MPNIDPKPVRTNDSPSFTAQLKLEPTDSSVKKFNKLMQVKELVAGAGTDQMKLLKSGIKFQDKFYFIKANALPILEIDQDSNLSFAADGAMTWASGRSITADAASITCDGNWLVIGGVRATGYTTGDGSTDYSGIDYTGSGEIDKFSIEIHGGIVTQFTKNS